ncbi:hypothetical protein EIP86_000489 [Pleurotus ostreatoroseus]|nr:hypothetical protein EIP86_000489 [Pleurotus ostreatoroseus]
MPVPASLPVPMPPDSDYTKQSYEVPGTRRPGQTGHYRGTAFPFLTLDSPRAFTNLTEFFDSGRSNVPSGDFPFLGRRPVISKNPLKYADHYEWWSWDTVDVRRRQLGSGVNKLFVDGTIRAPLRIVGIYSGNSPAMEPLEFEAKNILAAWGDQVGIKVMEMSEVEEIGKANLKPPAPMYPVVSFWVIMTHGNVANACFAQLHGLNFKQLPTAMVFLPLAHCYGRMTVIGIIGRGGSLGFWSNDPLLLLEDMKILRPTMLPAVPRVLNRIYQAGMAAANLPGVKGALFRRALQVKLDRLHASGVQTHPLWDRLVFKKASHAAIS